MKFSNCVQCAAKTCQGNDTRLTDFEGIKKGPQSGPLKNLEREREKLEPVANADVCLLLLSFFQECRMSDRLGTVNTK